ncbi:MAG: NAD-dependent protein deacetylase [Bacteroidetes bacterium]|jgi:NAD-dependent SIR2 family protein deacetylase|nr:NAD-dependent protein deacetylase [Bacteroidota bacterium]
MPPEALPGFDDLAYLLQGQRVVVLTGAGCSTESGIPDYRGPETRRKARNPIKYRAFVGEAAARRHYWARSAIGWPRFKQARPNDGHRALARLEAAGVVRGIITQNVDRLHQAAGSERVVELHGALAEVRCLDCGHLSDRDALQARMGALNPGWQTRSAEVAPDGDAELSTDATADFRVPGCATCGGVLKPNVVFFGENVPSETVDDAWRLFDGCDALLVVGSSLAVYSGYRFVREAAARRHPIAILNLGATRGDAEAWVRVQGRCGRVLPALAEALGTSPSSRAA